MTREEAIEVLKDIFNYTRFDTYTTKEARKMAIKALEQMPCEDATNGEVLLKMFPPSVYFGDNEKHLVLLTKDCELTCLNDEWWNAPYKAEGELIKALQYDRQQYNKGYADAKAEYESMLEKIRAEVEKECEPCVYEIDFAYKKGFSRALEIIDKYRKGQTNADSD